MRPPIDPEELAQVQALARLEAERDGLDPEAAARKAADDFRRAERTVAAAEMPASVRFRRPGRDGVDLSGLGWLEEAGRVVASPGRHHARRRNADRDRIILIAALAGMSRHAIARGIGTSRGNVNRILRGFAPASATGRPGGWVKPKGVARG